MIEEIQKITEFHLKLHLIWKRKQGCVGQKYSKLKFHSSYFTDHFIHWKDAFSMVCWLNNHRKKYWTALLFLTTWNELHHLFCLSNLVHITGLWCKSIMQTHPITCITSSLRTLKVSLSPWHPLSSKDVNYTLMKRFPWRRPTSRQTAVTRLLWQEEPQMLSAFRKVKTMFNVSLGGGHCLWDKTAVCSCKKEKNRKSSIARNMLKNAEDHMTTWDSLLVIIVPEIMALSTAETSALLTQNCTDMFTACGWNQHMFKAVLCCLMSNWFFVVFQAWF